MKVSLSILKKWTDIAKQKSYRETHKNRRPTFNTIKYKQRRLKRSQSIAICYPMSKRERERERERERNRGNKIKNDRTYFGHFKIKSKNL